MPAESGSSPDVAALVAPLLARLPEDHVPIFLALAERRAADRYRAWAATATNDSVCTDLLACADREEEIARRVEELFDDVAAIHEAIAQKIPELEDLIQAAFADSSIRQQLALQANGERAGAATWRSLATKAAAPAARDTLASCAELEEQSAEVLEALLATSPWPFSTP